jgi:hypothetical protein
MRSMQTFLISNHCHSRCGLSDAFILCYKRQNQISKLILFLCNYVLMMMFQGIVKQVMDSILNISFSLLLAAEVLVFCSCYSCFICQIVDYYLSAVYQVGTFV